MQAPDAAGLQRLVEPVGASLQAAQALTEGRRGPAFNHYKAAADALQSLSWVVYAGPNCGAPSARGWQPHRPFVEHAPLPGMQARPSMVQLSSSCT